MLSHFGLVSYVIWTAPLICVTNGAPIVEDDMLDKFLTDFVGCLVLDYVALPAYKSDDDASVSNTDTQGNYDLSVPLEICTTAPEKDNNAVHMCNEAFEIIRNLSTCRSDIKELTKAMPSSFETINITVQLDNVCKDFSASQTMLARKETYVAFKYADKDICPLVCQGKVLKACAFLLWGYKVQAKIYDALHSSVTPKKDVEVVQNNGLGNQDENHEAPGVGNSVVSSQNKQYVENMLAGKVSDHTKPGEHGISRSITDTESSDTSSQSSVGANEPSQVKPKEPEPAKNLLKQSEVPKAELDKLELPKGESNEGAVPKTKPEEGLVPPKTQASNHTLVVKASAISTTAAGGSTTVSLSGTPENGKGQHIHDGKSEKDELGTKAKMATASSTTNTEASKSTSENTEEKITSGKMDKEFDNNKVNNVALETVGKESKGISPSGSSVPGEDGVDELAPGAPKVPAKDQEYIEEETPLEKIGDKGSAKNEEESDDPPPDTENKLKPDTPVKNTLEQNLNTGNSPHEKTDVATVTKVTHSEAEDSASKAVLGTSDVMEEKSQVDEDDKEVPEEQFDMENNYNVQDSGLEPKEDMTSETEKPELQASADANKTPVKTFEKINVGFPEQEDTHFFFYFVTIVIFAIGGYVLFHNKQKIFALIIEGRHERRRRSGASYRKLETK